MLGMQHTVIEKVELETQGGEDVLVATSYAVAAGSVWSAGDVVRQR